MSLVKKIKSCWSKKEEISKTPKESAILTNLKKLYATRAPDNIEFLGLYYEFLGKFGLARPEASDLEAYNSCREAHPEWWRSEKNMPR